MHSLFIKQKLFSWNGQFTVKDDQQNDVYYVEGSFMQIPKTYAIQNTEREEVATITKKTFSFLPKFFVQVGNEDVLTITKEFSFLKSRYSIHGAGIEVNGNWWDMDFEVIQNSEVIGSVKKEWFTWGDSYKIDVVKDGMEEIMVAIVIAIDCVKADEAAAASSIPNM